MSDTEVSTNDAPKRPKKAITVASWITRLVVVVIFGMAGIAKLTGKADALVEAGIPSGGVLAIGIAEIGAALLLLIPATALLGAGLATAIMVGAVFSHLVGPVGMEGEAGSMLPLAITALVAAMATGILLIKGKLRS